MANTRKAERSERVEWTALEADVMVAIESLRTGEQPEAWARRLFRCTPGQCNAVKNKVDPFAVGDTPGGQVVSGFMNRRDGTTGGSLVLTHVNGLRVPHPQLIFGTPKYVPPPYACLCDCGCVCH
jgi:hypothetical protein